VRIGPAVEFTHGTWPDVSRTINAQEWDLLSPHLLRAGGYSDDKLEALRRYSTLLLQWNRKVSNLISKNDEERLLTRHLLESLEPAARLVEASASRWLDFGSGGGLPAIPLAIAGIGERWTLVESRRTKTLFLRRACEQLALKHVEVNQARLEDLVLDENLRGGFDAFTARATMTMGPTLELAAHFVRPGGWAFLWKGSRRSEEMEERGTWREQWDIDGLIGIGDGQVVVVRLKRKA
jgi:16S rRNA (guanine527-N7)-methyltransferase